jgi:eukaryotic-like serine/threonine-protein kinase
MTVDPDRWQRVQEICDAALSRTAADRAAFVQSACRDDASLRQDVEELLAQEQRADGFLSAPLAAVAAHVMGTTSTTSWAGRRIGVYDVLSPLGAGGMGEVYRARDTALGREVAIKVLPTIFTSDPERLTRFEREARVLAALNHPHIGAIYGLERVDPSTSPGQTAAIALVLELVDGDTLEERIAGRRSGLPMSDALAIARQITDALQAAHEKGIVHRDLKPANIKITANGTVKILDFGLAKAGGTSAPQISRSPTVTIGGTHDGVLLGTAAYMSPEQARGQTVDKRSDIWAFGCVLFEMLTGRMAFAGNTVSDHIAAIREREPGWAALPAATPSAVRRLLRRCLEKDSDTRLHDIADARLELHDTEGSSGDDSRILPEAARALHRWRTAAIGASIVASALLAILAVRNWRPASPVQLLTSRAVIRLPAGTAMVDGNAAVTVSPDGRTIVIAASADRIAREARPGVASRLYARPIDQLEFRPIPGTEGAWNPFFSPDGQWVGFAVLEDRVKLKKVALSGGAPKLICALSAFFSATWGDGEIYFTPSGGAPLSKVSDNGGVPESLTTLQANRREKTHRGPMVLPGGKALLMTVLTADSTSYDDARIELVSLLDGSRRVLIEGGMNARYVPTGHIVYARAGSLLAVPFDLGTLTMTGSPVPVVEDVYTAPWFGFANYAVSADGSLLYARGGAQRDDRSLVWVDRKGVSVAAAAALNPYQYVRLSKDGTRALLDVDSANTEVWLLDLHRDTFSRIVRGWNNHSPVWSPDERHIAFSSSRDTPQGFNMFRMSLDGAGEVVRVTTQPTAAQFPTDWAADGRILFQDQSSGESRGMWFVSADGGAPQRLFQNPQNEANATLSADGQWLAYQSEASGRSEINVRAFTGSSKTWRVSLDGGTWPVWSRDGRAIFFRQGDWMMAADVTSSSDFRTAKPRQLFREPTLVYGFDVAPDGRFLMIKGHPEPSIELVLVQNWFGELKARVPTR